MSKLTVTTFLSLDGVMQAPGGVDEDRSEGFTQGGWVVPYFDEDGGKLIADWFKTAGAFLLGRKTYEIFAAYWPRVTDANDPVASALNGLPKYVVSNTLKKVEWNNSTLIRGDIAQEVSRLKRLPVRELQVHGSGNLAQTLIREGLIDEYRLLIFPVVLGNGKRLFGDGAIPSALRLVDTKTTGRGVTVLTYRPAGKPEYGSFVLDEQGKEHSTVSR